MGKEAFGGMNKLWREYKKSVKARKNEKRVRANLTLFS